MGLILFCLALFAYLVLPSLIVSILFMIPFIQALGFIAAMRLFFPTHIHTRSRSK